MSQGPKYASTVAPPGYYDGLVDRIRTNLIPALKPYLEQATHVLELGSGTGVHAGVYVQDFDNIKSLQPTEADDILVNECRNTAKQTNECLVTETSIQRPRLLDARVLDVLQDEDWQDLARNLPSDGSQWDTVLINNCLHMIPFPSGAASIFEHLQQVTTPDAVFLASGPFKSDQGYFTESDGKFDQMIRARPQADELGIGLRSIDQLDRLAQKHGWQLSERHSIPKGNFLLVFRRLSS
ncbi:hypothetical protein ACM66B_004556 [Microbotryomycetes sp. NB124-2]